MGSFLDSLQFWHWWILGALLAAVEALAPGMFFIWFGAAALIVGLVALILPGMGWEAEVLLFAILAAIAVFFGRAFLRRPARTTADPALNRRAERYLGRRFTLETPIVNGRGSIKVDDSVWRAAGPELPAGRQVKVVGIEGTVLKVEAAD
jgi:membrane protein implicated in regulation of membrane protease activity